ncbi:MAG: polyprenyl synthetase family protein [Candidatus Micrarchaeota archaeon]|nr:polyprenyl synthetase family protein [Candidatus Micrarchaeota archaeon]
MDALERFYSKLSLVEAEMARVVPRNAQPAEVYGLIWEFLDRGGKRFRPMLALSCARAVGGTPADALPAAAAIELFHNFTLIHDDIEDDSQLRRGQPCLHIAHGLPLALNAGDGLFMMVWRAALRIRSSHAAAAQEQLLSAFTAVLEGQAIELNWHHSNSWDIGEKDYLRMVGGKTAALVEASCSVGALLGGGSPAQQKALARFGRSTGIAFQIQDDVLNLVGEVEKYQKEIGGDIREGKRTMMVLHALPRLASSDAQKMRSILGSQSADQSQIQWCVEQMKSAGSIDYASRYARRLVDGALKDLRTLPPSEARDELEAVAHYIISREK